MKQREFRKLMLVARDLRRMADVIEGRVRRARVGSRTLGTRDLAFWSMDLEALAEKLAFVAEPK